VVGEILAEARKMAGSVEGKEVVLRVHADVAKVLKSHQNKYLEELEEVLRRPVLIKSDSQLHHEKFDLA
jgi:ribonuclease G